MKIEHLKKIDEILQEMTDTNFVAGVNCMVLENGKPVYYGERGYIDLENKVPVKEDSIFRLYSMSKPVTAAAMMILVEDGKVDLNSPVGDFIPSFKNQTFISGPDTYPVKRPMKVKDLLNMTGGVTYPGNMSPTEFLTAKLCDEAIDRLNTDNEMSTMEFANRLGEFPLVFSPGESFQYSFGADILGAVIEAASGMRFGDFLKKRIFEPLGMNDTGFYVPKEKQNRLTKVYKGTENGLEEFFYNNLDINLAMDHEPAFQSGGAGLCTTILDYAKFATMLINGGEYEGVRVMQPGTVKWMTSAKMEAGPKEALRRWDGMEGYDYANLLRILKDPGKAVTIGFEGEYGWDGWLGPYFINDPVHKVTILQLIQRADAGTTPFMRRIRNVVFAAVED